MSRMSLLAERSSRSAWNARAAVARCSGARVLRTPNHVKASLTAAIVVRSLWAALRSSWVVGVVVGWVVDRLAVCWPVFWGVVVAVDIGARDLHESSGALGHWREQKKSLDLREVLKACERRLACGQAVTTHGSKRIVAASSLAKERERGGVHREANAKGHSSSPYALLNETPVKCIQRSATGVRQHCARGARNERLSRGVR